MYIVKISAKGLNAPKAIEISTTEFLSFKINVVRAYDDRLEYIASKLVCSDVVYSDERWRLFTGLPQGIYMFLYTSCHGVSLNVKQCKQILQDIKCIKKFDILEDFSKLLKYSIARNKKLYIETIKKENLNEDTSKSN